MFKKIRRFFNRKSRPQDFYGRTFFDYNLDGKSGLRFSQERSLTVAALYRGITYVASQVAKIPIQIKDQKNEALHNNRVSKLLNLKPNVETTAFSLKSWMISQALLNGNAYCEIERDFAGKAVALWPIHSYDVYPERVGPDKKMMYRVRGLNVDLKLEPWNIFHIRNLYSKDGVIGDGILRYASDVLDTARRANDFASQIFKNGGVPTTVIKHPNHLSKEAHERLKNSWNQFKGGTAVLEEGLDVQQLSFGPNTLQFLESRKFSVLEIARYLGVSPVKLYDTDVRRFRNVEQSNIESAIDTIDSWATVFEQEIDSKLLFNRRDGVHSAFDIYHFFRGDMAARSEYFQAMHNIGVLSSNDIRRLEGMNAYESGDRYFVPTNNLTPVDRLDEMIDSTIESKKMTGKMGKDAKPKQMKQNGSQNFLYDYQFAYPEQDEEK